MSKLSDAIELWSQSLGGNRVFGYIDFDDEFDTEWKNGSLEIQLSLGEQYPAFVRYCRSMASSISLEVKGESKRDKSKRNFASLFAIRIEGSETDILEVVETGLPYIEEACLKSGLALPGSKVVIASRFLSNKQILAFTPGFIRSLMKDVLVCEHHGYDVRQLLGEILPASAMPPKKRARNNAFTNGMLIGVRLNNGEAEDWFYNFDSSLPNRTRVSDFAMLSKELYYGLSFPNDIDIAIANSFSQIIFSLVCAVVDDSPDEILDNLYLHTRNNTLHIAMTHGGKWIKPQTLDLSNVDYNFDMAIEIISEFVKTIEVCDRSRFAQVCQNRGA